MIADDQSACDVFEDLAATRSTITSPGGRSVVISDVSSSTAGEACRDGSTITVSLPEGTERRLVGVVVDAVSPS